MTTTTTEVGRILGSFDRIQFTVPELNREVLNELRWNSHEAEATRDGIDITTLELSSSDISALKLIARADVASILRNPGRASVLEEAAVKAMTSSSAVGLLRTRLLTPEQFVEAGRSFERLWLAATRLGLQVQPWTAFTFVARLIDVPDGVIFNDREKQELRLLRDRLDLVFARQCDWPHALLFRVFRAPKASKASLRRRLDDVVEVAA